MKAVAGAILITLAVVTTAHSATQTPASAPARAPGPGPSLAPPSLDERVGCGLVLVTLDDFVRRYPSLEARVGRNGGQAMVRMVGANGATLLDAAFAEGAAQGVRPSALHRRGVGYVAEAFKGLKGPSDQAGKERAMQLLQRCLTVAAPAE